jgi:hypothetical protein
MSANRHAADANDEAGRVHLIVQAMCEQSLLGVAPTSEELAALHRSLACVRYHAARTVYATSQFPAPDRRAPAATATLGDIPTPLAALETLLAECELTLDYRPTFRHAMSTAFASIAEAKKPRAALPDSIVLGERIEVGDEELTFAHLFGEPDRSTFNPRVLAAARGMAQPSEVAHG